MDAFMGEAALFIPAFDSNSPVAPSDLTALYRDTALYWDKDTALYGRPLPCCCVPCSVPPTVPTLGGY